MKKYKHLLCLLLAAALLLSCLTCCAPKETEPLELTPSYGTITPDPLAIIRGENKLILTSEIAFLDEIEEHPEAVTINYGWGECHPSKITKRDDYTLDINFDAEAASEEMDAENLSYMGYLSVLGDYSKEGNAVLSKFPIATPSLSASGSAVRDSSFTTIELEIKNTTFAKEVDPDDIDLTYAFEGMQVAEIQRISDAKIILTLKGEVKSEGENLIPYIQGGISISPSSTNAAVHAYGEVPLVTATAYLGSTPTFIDKNTLRISVLAENCQWNDDLEASQLTLSGAFSEAAIQKVEKCTKHPNGIDVYLTISQENCDGVGSVVFADTATNAGQPVGIDVHFDDIGFYAELQTLKTTEDKATLVISAAPHGIKLNKTLLPEDITLEADFEHGTVENIHQNEDSSLEISISLPRNIFDEIDGYEGIIRIPEDNVISEYANVEHTDTTIHIGAFKDTKPDEPAKMADTNCHDNGKSILLLAANDTILLAEEEDDALTNMLCGFIKDGLSSLVSAGAGKAGGFISGHIMNWLGFESNEQMVDKRFQEIVDQLDSISSRIDQIEQNIDKLISAVETSSFKEQMRDIQTSVLKLKSRIPGYQAALGDLSSIEVGSDEYKKEFKILADKINNPNSMDFHGETYALGEKIMSDAAGTADGALKAHFDRVTTLNNWEQQTYAERERFYLYSVGTYFQAATLDSIALGYTAEMGESRIERSEAQKNLESLKAQVKRVAELAEKYQVKRLKPDYNRNLRINAILETNVDKVTYDANNPMVSEADAYRMMQQALLEAPKTKTPAGYATAADGVRSFTLPDSLRLLTEKQALDIMKYSSKNNLVEELKSVGFTIPTDCPDAVVTRDIRIEKRWHRNGNAKYYYIDVYYKTVTKNSAEHPFAHMAFYGHKSTWLPNPIDIDPDINKAQRARSQGSTMPVTTASIKQIADSSNLYI